MRAQRGWSTAAEEVALERGKLLAGVGEDGRAVDVVRWPLAGWAAASAAATAKAKMAATVGGGDGGTGEREGDRGCGDGGGGSSSSDLGFTINTNP